MGKKLIFPQRIDRKTVYESQWINLHTDIVLMPSGKIIDKYHILDYQKKGVVVLLMNSKKEICFIKSLRYTTQKVEWELPAGSIEKSENALQAAKREVLEETGYKTKSLKHLYKFNPSNGMSNQIIYAVLGFVSYDKHVPFDTDEVAKIHWLSLKEVIKLIKTKKITDAIALIPLLLYLTNTHKNVT